MCKRLDAAGIDYVLNERLVRGLDYYNRTVFEWVTTELGAQGTVCAGGRYDGLVEQLGGKPTPAVGFAMGIERLVLLLESQDKIPLTQTVDVYVIAVDSDAELIAPAVAEKLRSQMPGLKVQLHSGSQNMKKKLIKADKSGADYALIVRSDDYEIKHLREREQEDRIVTTIGDVAAVLI